MSTKGQIYHTVGGGEEAWSRPASRQPRNTAVLPLKPQGRGPWEPCHCRGGSRGPSPQPGPWQRSSVATQFGEESWSRPGGWRVSSFC